MFRKTVCILLIVSVLFFTSCAAHVHRVGEGSQRYDVSRARQWYVIWGVVPLNHVDSHAMAAGARNYRITTFYSPIDLLITTILVPLTITTRTVLVEK